MKTDANPVERRGGLSALVRAENECRRCDLWRNATQAVPGEGRAGAKLMLVGEQPGDYEDRAGHPFVGPAGRLLDRALDEAGIERRSIFVTNAVKHFKHQMRGKRRLHQRPNAGEVDICRWWLEQELALVKPRLAVALGATAYRSLAGRPGLIGKLRGKLLPDVAEVPIFVTIHPSALLRLRDESERAAQFDQFVKDLAECGRILGSVRR